MRAKLHEVKDQLKRRRQEPIPVQGRWLRSVLQGHFAYYAVPGNSDAVLAFRFQGNATLVQGAAAPQPAHAVEVGTDEPSRETMATTRPREAPVP